MDLPATSDQADTKEKFLSSTSLCCIPAEGGAQIWSGFSKLKCMDYSYIFPGLNSGLQVDIPTSN